MKKNKFVCVHDFQKNAYEKFWKIYDKMTFVSCVIDVVFFVLLFFLILTYYFSINKIIDCIVPLFIFVLFGGYILAKNKHFSSLYEKNMKIVPDRMNLKSIFARKCYKNFSLDEIDYTIDYITQKMNSRENTIIVIPMISLIGTGIFQTYCSDLFSSICKKLSSSEEEKKLFSVIWDLGNSEIVDFLFWFALIYIVVNFLYKYFTKYRYQQFIDVLNYLKSCYEKNYAK